MFGDFGKQRTTETGQALNQVSSPHRHQNADDRKPAFLWGFGPNRFFDATVVGEYFRNRSWGRAVFLVDLAWLTAAPPLAVRKHRSYECLRLRKPLTVFRLGSCCLIPGLFSIREKSCPIRR